MRILVVSDTHGYLKKLERAIEKEAPIDMLLHLGDVCTSEESVRALVDPACPVAIVKGNCDVCSDWVSVRDFNLGKHRIHMEHGNYLPASVQSIAYRAEELGADIIMFGHTHIPLLKKVGNVTVINPGSITLPHQADLHPTYMIIEMDEEGEMMFLPRQL